MVESRQLPAAQVEDAEEKEKRKSSTLNSMFISTTISNPNVESIISAVATIIHS
jgi:hypothetical protein